MKILFKLIYLRITIYDLYNYTLTMTSESRAIQCSDGMQNKYYFKRGYIPKSKWEEEYFNNSQLPPGLRELDLSKFSIMPQPVLNTSL
jgi:hypothetical protein